MNDPTNTLVIVDDDPLVLKALQRALRPAGYAVHAFASPAEALLFLESYSVGVIIADQNMPGMDGAAFLQRAARRRPGASRILLTGFPHEQQISALVNASGAWRYVTKPWSNAELLSLVAAGFERFAQQAGMR